MNHVLLDTHVLVWLLEGSQRLGSKALEMANSAAQEDALSVSAITFWEVAMLAQRGRLVMAQPVISWRLKVLESGVLEVPMSGDIGILATEFEDFPADAADRIIAATAMGQGATLITADHKILDWKGHLSRHNARR